MQMKYCFVNNIHVDYAKLLWEGLYFSLHHPTSSILYLRFTKIIISHYMTSFPEISRRARDRYHNLKDDDIMKNIFNSGRYKDKVGMNILDWMISEEMKNTEHYRMTPSAPRSPNPKMDTAESSAPKRSTVICFRLPKRRSTQEQGSRENVELVKEHLASVEIEKMVEGSENLLMIVEITKDEEVVITNDKEVEITNVVIPVNFNKEEKEITDEVYELKRREKGKIIEESRSTPFPTPIRSPRIHTDLVSSNTEKLQELTGPYTYLFKHLKARFLSRKSFDTLADHLQEVMVESLPTMRGNIQAEISSQIHKAIDNHIPSQVEASVRSYMSGHILHVHLVQSQTLSVQEQQYQLYLSMKADPQLQQQDIPICLALQMKFESLQVPQTTCRSSAVRLRDQDDPHDDAHPEGENHAKQ
ncbi:hypothetical protein Tco_0170228 [Tanacetum coccineum]